MLWVEEVVVELEQEIQIMSQEMLMVAPLDPLEEEEEL
jgi:hypothetical protein